ncbi:MAG: 4Fe-4S dicluster domain-containing protein [Desulfotignum sp.]|nr:4Fe-4S dicluster domain-containing protein [Desulfotignum sp.]MCF8112741.1 4Fe-4S dicluster domain-containing protein [Desulfotignum sp.]
MALSDVREKPAARPEAARRLEQVKDKVAACIQCGTCSASCPNAEFMDMTPRRMWRALLAGRVETVFLSQTFILCASCYMCTLRCPRGLPLTWAMAGLKQAAFSLYPDRFRRSALFYRAFMDNIRQYGRVREMEMMTRYFLALKHPLVPLGYTSMGIRLMAKHKLHLRLPSAGPGRLAPLFDRAGRQEG